MSKYRDSSSAKICVSFSTYKLPTNVVLHDRLEWSKPSEDVTRNALSPVTQLHKMEELVAKKDSQIEMLKNHLLKAHRSNDVLVKQLDTYVPSSQLLPPTPPLISSPQSQLLPPTPPLISSPQTTRHVRSIVSASPPYPPSYPPLNQLDTYVPSSQLLPPTPPLISSPQSTRHVRSIVSASPPYSPSHILPSIN